MKIQSFRGERCAWALALTHTTIDTQSMGSTSFTEENFQTYTSRGRPNPHLPLAWLAGGQKAQATDRTDDYPSTLCKERV